ncbi:MAG: cobalt ECF transporter T component CbiQ [Firmicutes bacterium HGW-Firmicutes-14]|nr:MAG: cobalt ECF transporter T component CbiQ [Firmicutes bacterium HGW-Firmicutes-14]
MLNIDGFAYTNRLKNVHPTEKAVFALLTLFLCLVFSSFTVSCLTLLLMTVVTVRRAGIPYRAYFRMMAIPFSFLVVGVLTIGITITTQRVEQEWLGSLTAAGVTFGVTSGSIIKAAELAGKSLAAVSCLYFLALTTPVVDLTAAMRKLRIPSLFIELTELTYRFIFVLQETAEDIYLSQSVRWGYSSLKNSYKSLGSLTATLFLRAHHRSGMIFTALTARGYNGQLSVLAPEYRVSTANILMITVVELLLLSVGVIAEVKGI